ncbi:MAG: hypothetical protein ABSF21_05845 [Dehalococcoidia bacterium]
MIGCLMLLPLAGLLLAGTAVTSTLTIAMGAVTSMLTIAMGMFMGTLMACATAFLAFWMFILS